MFSTVLLLASTVVCSSALVDLSTSSYNCTAKDFKCKDNHCVPMHARCDGSNDCGDFSDEKDCDFYLCKEPNFFRCKNHRCISRTFLCDKENDCEDFSDEQDCENFKLEHIAINSTCAKGEWQCTDKLCIPEEWVCNQEVDCLDGSDEGVGCSMNDEECDGFRCKNKRCIPSEWRCDGHDDCSDNSDETDCEHHFDRKQCTFDQKKYLCHDDKACIDLKSVCNGKNDCFDQSDEGGLCSHSELNCANHGCSHECVQLPTGPRCLCPPGYHNVDEKTCVDINECEEYGICDQKCKNMPGSYECYCEYRYAIQDDKRTCKAIGGEATMIFTSRTQIRSYLLTTDLLFPIANNLKQVVGITADSHHIYWTDIYSEHETIVKATEDGSDRELIVTSGLGLPEDIEVDWLTGNLYFTDVQKQHIGVCTNDGSHCTVLINEEIRKPRAIVLNVNDGTMYWTDWGSPSEIAFSYMDGTSYKPFLKDDIHWPNGLALDYPNERLYWTDAKKKTLESIRLDGTDRRIVLQSVVKHPFAISIFENRLYWSDWETHSIDSCDKFTGKNYHTVIKESQDYIYGISIYHSALQSRADNPCALAFCSDICLLSGTSYICACSEGRELSSDKHTCKHIEKRQMLIVAAKNILINVEHKSLGRHSVTMLPSIVKNAGAVTYDSQNHSLFISDLETNHIVELNLHTGARKPLRLDGLGKITSMDYDPTGNNLYVCDSEKATLEVISLNTMSHKVLIHDAENEIPQSVAVVPQQGLMFVGFYDKANDKAHIDRMYMDGSGRTHIVERGLDGPLSLHYDSHYNRIFFADGGKGDIEHTNVDGDERHSFKTIHATPVDVTTLNNDLFWTTRYSPRLYWAQKSSGENTQKITLDISTDVDRILVTSVTPGAHVISPCQKNNGNCSHLCLSSHKTIVCACPARMMLEHDNKTCIHRQDCDPHEFMCSLSNTCILSSLKCDGKNDCPMGEDEDDCKKPSTCPIGYFGCDDGACILEKQVCDHHFDCKDKSDEHQCHNKQNGQKCAPNHFMCGDGSCVADRFVCDGVADCVDNSDELNCMSNTCGDTQFRCDSGECIPKSWECDHDYDCNDLSDEHSGCASITCSSHMFTCNNGKCVDKTLVCDRSNDCGDDSDEISCALPFNGGHCKLHEYACYLNSSICLHHTVRCNGTAECPGGEDEKNCTNCDLDSFECGNKKCIPNLWLCDGADDCGDNTDENNTLCQWKTHKDLLPTRFSHVPCNDGFRCKSGACISLDLLCNDKHDCFDESDEGGLCSKSCDALNNPCSQDCIKTPAGPMCRCKEGYKLMGDGHTCKDINECEQDPPICSQLCFNAEGSYFCDCYEGFNLRADKKSCKSTGPPMSLIYTLDNQIREITKKTNSLRILYSEEMPRITALDISMKDNTIYFTIENSATIQRINADTKKRQYIEHIGHPRKIAYDWSTGHIYYYDARSDTKTISICSFEEMLCTKLIDIDMHRHVSELVVDSVNRVLFYSVTSWWVFNSPNYVLYRTNLDGTESVEVVKSTTGYITGLAYDVNKKQLYYADQHEGQIFRVAYDGKQKTAIFSNLTRPTGLKFFENTLYFSTSNGDITKCHLYGPRACDTFKIHALNFDMFTLSQAGLQPEVENPCRNATCEYLCVASSSQYKCLCEGGKLIGKSEKCPKVERSSLSDERPFELHSVDLPSGDDSKRGSATLISVLLVSLGVILAGVVLIFYAKKRHSGQFNISMRFYNPTYNRTADGMEKPILTPGQHEYTNPMPDGRAKEIELRGGSFSPDNNQNVTHLVDM